MGEKKMLSKKVHIRCFFKLNFRRSIDKRAYEHKCFLEKQSQTNKYFLIIKSTFDTDRHKNINMNKLRMQYEY